MIAQALMAWLEAVLAEIPVWSGASRATFVKLADRSATPARWTGDRQLAHGLFTVDGPHGDGAWRPATAS